MAEFHPYYEPELVRLVGATAIEASGMDLLVSLILAHLTGQTMDVGANTMFPEDTRKKAGKLQSLKLPTHLRQAIDLIPDIMSERALIIHGFSVHSADLSERFHIGLRGKYKDKPQSVTIARVTEFLKGVALVNGVLFRFLQSEGLTEAAPEIPPEPVRP